MVVAGLAVVEAGLVVEEGLVVVVAGRSHFSCFNILNFVSIKRECSITYTSLHTSKCRLITYTACARVLAWGMTRVLGTRGCRIRRRKTAVEDEIAETERRSLLLHQGRL